MLYWHCSCEKSVKISPLILKIIIGSCTTVGCLLIHIVYLKKNLQCKKMNLTHRTNKPNQRQGNNSSA